MESQPQYRPQYPGPESGPWDPRGSGGPPPQGFPGVGGAPGFPCQPGFPAGPEQPGRGTRPAWDAPGPRLTRRQRSGKPPKPKRKRGVGTIILIVVFSPFIGLWYLLCGVYWCVTCLLTPVFVALHLALWPLGCAWAGLLRLCGASGRSRFRPFVPIPPHFPALFAVSYWKWMRSIVKGTFETLWTIGEVVGSVAEIFS